MRIVNAVITLPSHAFIKNRQLKYIVWIHPYLPLFTPSLDPVSFLPHSFRSFSMANRKLIHFPPTICVTQSRRQESVNLTCVLHTKSLVTGILITSFKNKVKKKNKFGGIFLGFNFNPQWVLWVETGNSLTELRSQDDVWTVCHLKSPATRVLR